MGEEIDSDIEVGNNSPPPVEFDFPLQTQALQSNGDGTATDYTQRHTNLASLLGLSNGLPSLLHVFNTVASLCDPFTQPEESEHSILSLDCVSDLVIAISYSNLKYTNIKRSGSATAATDDAVLNPELQSLKFDLSLAYFTILQAVLTGLNCEDELKLRYVDNDEDHWYENLPQWTPHIEDEYDLKICYRMACVLIMCIYKLFKTPDSDGKEGYNLATNPYLHYFIKTWKCQTNVILLGLEIDRRLERMDLEEGDDEENLTPFIVHAALKGSSSIRYVVTWILNQNPSVVEPTLESEEAGAAIAAAAEGGEAAKHIDESITHRDIKGFEDSDYDIKCESLINFIHPLAKKKVNGGALSIDMRLVVIALLIVNVGYSTKQPDISSLPQPPASEDWVRQWEFERRQNQNKPIADIGDILIDLEYEDRFDEDIKYIFDFEYEDGDWEDDEEIDDDEERVKEILSAPKGGSAVAQIADKKNEKDGQDKEVSITKEMWEEELKDIEQRLKDSKALQKRLQAVLEMGKNGTSAGATAELLKHLEATEGAAATKPRSTSNSKTSTSVVAPPLPPPPPAANPNPSTTQAASGAKISTAVRSDDAIEFDELGRDWRDLPRGENVSFQPWFLKAIAKYDKLTPKQKLDPDDFFSQWYMLQQCMQFLTLEGIESNDEGDMEDERKVGQSILNTIAKTVKDEADGVAVPVDSNPESLITPDKIYDFWSSLATDEEIATTQDNNVLIIPIFGITKFELLLHNNPKLACCMLDEMLMCKGYRRVLIWFITHNINLCPALINYVFELLVGLRGGTGDRHKPYTFSRQGSKIILSEIEVSMLLHEFISNSGLYLMATKDGVESFYGYKIVLSDSIAIKYSTLMCLMIDQLINSGVIDLHAKSKDGDMYDYTYNLQFFLITWIGKLPEARELFFRIKNARGEAEGEDDKTKQIESSKESAENGAVAGPSRPSYTMGDLKELIAAIRPMSVAEVNEYFTKNSDHFSLVKLFAGQLEEHLKWLLCQNDKERVYVEMSLGPKSPLHVMQQDFRFFLENFNTLCKVDYLAEYLFRKLEKNLQNGQIFAPLEVEGAEGVARSNDQVTTIGEGSNGGFGREKDPQVLEDLESEFSGIFLDGEGKFSEDKPAGESSSKKKKNKKKKKGKKK